ncbi:hypothetical protein CPB83DRAFT_900045 [Crepidotus variabilis]|uniref:Uncharacterized protein n=1 Tax=Crepidotus variabilis TaxID=179855 RepID=A0A9P6JI43_9AGAR|nr:hypothetical protein CPB83DRAFT_900045 [Crepidotus variabilis]
MSEDALAVEAARLAKKLAEAEAKLAEKESIIEQKDAKIKENNIKLCGANQAIQHLQEKEQQAKINKENMIPKPKGQAGHDYNLDKKMGLRKETRTHLNTILCVVVGQSLDTTLPYSEQLVNARVPLIEKFFVGLWPLQQKFCGILSHQSHAYASAMEYFKTHEEVPFSLVNYDSNEDEGEEFDGNKRAQEEQDHQRVFEQKKAVSSKVRTLIRYDFHTNSD